MRPIRSIIAVYELTEFSIILALFHRADITFLFVIFRKDTRPAITKMPTSYRNLSSSMQRSMLFEIGSVPSPSVRSEEERVSEFQIAKVY